MGVINIAGFGGSNLAIDPKLLPEPVGTDVVDAEPGRGDLRPLRQRLTVATVPTSPQRKTIWRMGQDNLSDTLYWLSWSTVVDAARGFDTEDTTERTYFTGNGTPKWTDNVQALGTPPYPQAVRELGVPAPIHAALLVLTTNGPIGDDGVRFYVHTFVNDIGWESAPSPPSAGLTCKPNSIVAINNLPAAPAGNYNITARRIYRTQPGTSNETDFFFLREVPIGTTSTTDDARALGDVMATTGWRPPPDNSFGLSALWNGMFAVLTVKTVHISEPGAPYAYKAGNDIALKNTAVTSVVWEQNLLVLTSGEPVLIQGQDPSGMSDSPLGIVYPCVSARSATSMGHGACWASSEGLAYCGTGGMRLVTEGIMTPRQWKALVPSTMVAGRWGRWYVCSFTAGTRRGFMIDPRSPGEGIWWLSAGFDACFYDKIGDELFVLEGGNIRKFDGASSVLTAQFTSKRFQQASPQNYSHGVVVATGYPVAVVVTSRYTDIDGTEMTIPDLRTVVNADPFTLRSGYLAESVQVTVQSANNVQAVRLATDIRLLKQD